MNFTITFPDWYLIPLLITVISLIYAAAKAPEPQPGGMIPDVFSPLLAALYYATAIIISLLAWLVWAVLT